MQRYTFKDFIFEFWYFGIKQAWACIFGGLMLAGILITKYTLQNDFIISRYDFLFFYALSIQAILLITKLENLEEAKVIFIFHLVGTIMEILKTHMGSWIYPEHNILRIGGVPLFSGFMYSAVGSYLSRVWRIFRFEYTLYPPIKPTIVISVLIYMNFFTHHYIYDFRYIILLALVAIYLKTKVHYKPHNTYRDMPLLLGFFLVALFIWLGENLATLSSAWVYPNQHASWKPVSFSKITSWFMLMIISFVMVSLVHRPKPHIPEPSPAI